MRWNSYWPIVSLCKLRWCKWININDFLNNVITARSLKHTQKLQVNICPYKCLKSKNEICSMLRSQVLNANQLFQDQYELNQWALTADHFRFVEHFQSVHVAPPVLKSKHPVNFITTVLLRVARYLSLSQAHVCRGRGTLWGERSEASFLPAAFKVTAEKQPKCEFSSSEFQNKERKKHPTETSLEQSTRPVDRI